MQNTNQLSKWGSLATYLLMLLVNILALNGALFQQSPLVTISQYDNYFVPASFTFWIWPLVYIAAGLHFILEVRLSGEDQFLAYYRQLVQPKLLEVYLFNILWVVCLSQDLLLVALIASLVYMQRLLTLLQLISGTPILRQHPYYLKYPVGLHFGAALSAAMMTFSMYIVSRGLAPTGRIMFWMAIAILIVTLAMSAFYYAKYGNQASMLPVLWYMFGVMMRYMSWERDLFITSILLFIIGLILYISIFRQQIFQNRT